MEAKEVLPQEPQRVRIEGVDGSVFPLDSEHKYLILVDASVRITRESAQLIQSRLRDIGVDACLVGGSKVRVFELEKGR